MMAAISIEGFLTWIYDVPIESLILFLFFPIIIEFSRYFGKVIFLGIYNLQNSKNKFEKPLLPPILKPKITIMIPAHNEEYGIQKSIESVINNEYTNKEIIVIDDGSTDNTYEIAKKYHDKGLIKIVHRDDASGSKAQALNYGSMYATGSIILVIDGDSQLDKYSLNEAAKCFHEDKDISAISGNLKVLTGDDGVKNILTKMQDYEFLTSVDLARRFTTVFNIIMVISGAIGAFRKDVFEMVGKYDVDTIGEDFDLTLKINKLGKIIKFSHKTSIHFYCPNNIRALIQQRIRWSHAQIQTLLKHKDVLWKSKYRTGFRLAIMDMWIMDVLINFAWIGSISLLVGFLLISQFHELEFIAIDEIIYLSILIFPIYFISELIQFLYAIHVSGRKQSLSLIWLIPLMIFVYRPLIRIITIRGHIGALLGSKISW